MALLTVVLQLHLLRILFFRPTHDKPHSNALGPSHAALRVTPISLPDEHTLLPRLVHGHDPDKDAHRFQLVHAVILVRMRRFRIRRAPRPSRMRGIDLFERLFGWTAKALRYPRQY